jgi:hypothetical protein
MWRKCLHYSWVKCFWRLKCVNWNIGASHLPEDVSEAPTESLTRTMIMSEVAMLGKGEICVSLIAPFPRPRFLW